MLGQKADKDFLYLSLYLLKVRFWLDQFSQQTYCAADLVVLAEGGGRRTDDDRTSDCNAGRTDFKSPCNHH